LRNVRVFELCVFSNTEVPEMPDISE
jgi:hypothetical protein